MKKRSEIHKILTYFYFVLQLYIAFYIDTTFNNYCEKTSTTLSYRESKKSRDHLYMRPDSLSRLVIFIIDVQLIDRRVPKKNNGFVALKFFSAFERATQTL